MAEWRAIPGWEGIYEVSRDGAVRSLERVLQRASRGKIECVNRREQVLRPHIANGYFRVHLKAEGRRETAYIHRLVCTVFHGLAPLGCEAAHGDGNKQNNEAGNLRWATREENMADKKSHGTQPHGERVYNARLTEDQAREALYAKSGIRALARKFGVHPATLTSIRIGKSWRHLREAARWAT